MQRNLQRRNLQRRNLVSKWVHPEKLRLALRKERILQRSSTLLVNIANTSDIHCGSVDDDLMLNAQSVGNWVTQVLSVNEFNKRIP
jgi:hypothetical protein